jgi:hypothetical protein
MGSIYSENIHNRLLDVIFQKTVFYMVTFNRETLELPSVSACPHISTQKEIHDFGQNLRLLVE